MPDYTPVFLPGQIYTTQASAAITGGQLVEVSGSGTVAPAALNSVKVVGMAARDAASGSKLPVILDKVVHESVSAGGSTAGDSLGSGAAGTVATVAAAVGAAAGTRIGIALTTAIDAAVIRWVAL
jgi:hypothetical protein